MAQHLVELCTLLVEECFGDVASLIWAHLAERGRTQFAGLTALARVTPSQLSRYLPILISNRAVVYYVDPDYNATWYSVDIEGTYNLVRMSKLGDIVKERCGKDAAHVILNMAQLGQVTVGELVKIYDLQGAQKEMAHTNGETTVQAKEQLNTTPIKTADQLHAALLQLIKSGFLVKATSRLFHTDYDVQHTLEKSVQEEHFPDGKVSGPKASHLFAQAVNSQKRKQRDDDIVPGITEGYANKRQKLNGNHATARQLPDELALSINMRKYIMALRSRSYVKLAARHLGGSSATVYDHLLQVLERQLHDVNDGQAAIDEYNNTDQDDDEDCFVTATAASVYDILDPNTDFTASIKIATKDLPTSKNGAQPREDFSSIGIKQEQDSDDDGAAELSSYQNRAKLLELIEKHLQSLEEHAQHFCHRQGQGKPAVWTVNFRSLTERIILAELDMSISARFGKPAVRLLRLLRDKGKLEEKQIAASAFMQMKDVRQILSELYGAGYVEAQELAKDQTRQPAKALYLWYFDGPKVQRMLIHQCYQSMARAYQRLAAERRRYKNALKSMRAWNAARYFGNNYHTVRAQLDGQAQGAGLAQAEEPVDDDDIDANFRNEDDQEETNDAGSVHDDDKDGSQADGPDDDKIEANKAISKRKQGSKSNGAADDSTTELTNGGDHNDQTAMTSTHSAPPIQWVLGQTGLWRTDALHNFDKEGIKKWRAIESNYIGQIMRLDDMIVLLRDFDGRHSLSSA